MLFHRKIFFTAVLLGASRLLIASGAESDGCDLTVNLSNAGIDKLDANFVDTKCVKHLLLRNNSIDRLEPGFFDRHSRLETLDLSGNRLKLNDVFRELGQSTLKVLILDGNYVQDEDSNPFDGTENNVTSNPKTLVVPGTFPELTHLSLRNVRMNAISENWLDRFPKLKHLDLSENTMDEEVLMFLLKNIPATITDIALENTGLTIVRSEQLNALEYMRLSHNYIPILTSHKCYENILCLESMDNLKVLAISNCSVRIVNENAFRYTKNLLELDLSSNNLRLIHEKTLNQLAKLESLNLSRNPLLVMPSIDQLRNLTTLVMDGMKGKKLFASMGAFVHLPRLRNLSLRENELTAVSHLFDNLPALEKLDLSDNRISILPSWQTQKSLRQLNLNFNRVENLDKLDLRDAGSLELLLVANNSVTKIKTGYLKILSNIEIVL